MSSATPATTPYPAATQPGFADPVGDAQACFRALLEALSLPCRAVPLPVMPPVKYLSATFIPERLAALVAVALTLCDADTPVWLDDSLNTPGMRQHLRFHCGCPIVESPGEARFAFIGNARTMPRLVRFNAGEPEYPDRSTTLVIATDWNTEVTAYHAFGPGISPVQYPGGIPATPGGLPPWFWDDWAENNAAYPLGVDAFFVGTALSDNGGAIIAGFPRTTSVTKAERL